MCCKKFNWLLLVEAYKSLHEAINHGGIANKYKVKIKWIDAEELETKDPEDIKSLTGTSGCVFSPEKGESRSGVGEDRFTD